MTAEEHNNSERKQIARGIRQFASVFLFLGSTWIGFQYNAFHWWLVLVMVLAFVGAIGFFIKTKPIRTSWGTITIGGLDD